MFYVFQFYDIFLNVFRYNKKMDNMDAHSQSQHGDNTTEVPNDPG